MQRIHSENWNALVRGKRGVNDKPSVRILGLTSKLGLSEAPALPPWMLYLHLGETIVNQPRTIKDISSYIGRHEDLDAHVFLRAIRAQAVERQGKWHDEPPIVTRADVLMVINPDEMQRRASAAATARRSGSKRPASVSEPGSTNTSPQVRRASKRLQTRASGSGSFVIPDSEDSEVEEEDNEVGRGNDMDDLDYIEPGLGALFDEEEMGDNTERRIEDSEVGEGELTRAQRWVALLKEIRELGPEEADSSWAMGTIAM